MPPMIQDNWQFLLMAGAVVYFFYVKQKKAKAASTTPPAPVYIQTPAAPAPDLADQFVAYQDRREREVKNALAMAKLDKMVLYEDTLNKIAECVPKPVNADPKS